MITLLTGENSYGVEQVLRQLTADFSGVVEKFDGGDLELKQLPDLLMGVNLFSEKRMVVIRGLSQNKSVWEALPEWLARLSDDIHLVLVESKPDKRTKTYKTLQKDAEVHEFKPWTERDVRTAEKWAEGQAIEKLTSNAARLLVARVGVDQWQLAQAIEKLSVYDAITEDLIRENIEAQPHENVFVLFETALKGDTKRVQEMIATLSLGEEPYQLFGLLSGQVFQLAALAAAREGDDVAKDLGAHPFVLSKLKPYARECGVRRASEIVATFTTADEAMKTSSIDPWLAIERALLGISTQM